MAHSRNEMPNGVLRIRQLLLEHKISEIFRSFGRTPASYSEKIRT
jgi:hypothetical protein